MIVPAEPAALQIGQRFRRRRPAAAPETRLAAAALAANSRWLGSGATATVRRGAAIPVRSASRSNASGKPSPSIAMTKSIAVPCAPQPKQ